MKLIKRLKPYTWQQEIKESVLGFGIFRARDYEVNKYGHLLIISLNSKRVHFLKKVFIPL